MPVDTGAVESLRPKIDLENLTNVPPRRRLGARKPGHRIPVGSGVHLHLVSSKHTADCSSEHYYCQKHSRDDTLFAAPSSDGVLICVDLAKTMLANEGVNGISAK
jgi:hypothetical protein